MDVVEEHLNDSDSATSAESSSSNDTGQLNIGKLLVEARENQHLTADDITEQMNLTVSVITKIENNEFEQDIPIAFIRGYVRSYAQKVGVDVENICAEFDRQTGQEVAPVENLKVVSDFKKRREINSNSFIFKLITFMILMGLFALGGWELYKSWNKPKQDEQLDNEIPLTNISEPQKSDEIATTDNLEPEDNFQIDDLAVTELNIEASSESAVTGQSTNSISNVSQDPELSSTEVLDENANSVSQNQEAQLSQAFEEEAQSAPLITGPLRDVVFTFTADCWVKVTDANGEVMAIGLKKAGKVMPVEGVAPIDVTLGEPTAVTVEFNGEAYDISRFRAGRTARFTLNE